MKIPQPILHLLVKDLIASPSDRKQDKDAGYCHFKFVAIQLNNQCCTGDARHNNKERKGNKKCKEGKKEAKLSLSAGDMLFTQKIPGNLQTTKTKNKSSKVSDKRL